MQYVVILIFVAIGVATIVNPFAKKVQSNTAKRAVKNSLQELREEKEDDESLFEDIYKSIQKYNIKLFLTKQSSFTGETPSIKDGAEIGKTKSGIDISKYGNVRIEHKVQLRRGKEKTEILTYPLNLTASHSNIDNGFVVMKGTSIPIGGLNTLSVLYGNAKKNLGLGKKINIKTGDKIIIESVWGEVIYQVTEMGTLLKNNSEALKIQKGDDKIALLIAGHDKNIRLCIIADRQVQE